MLTMTRDGDVVVLNLGDEQNRFTPDFVATFNDHLDSIEATDGPCAVVTTGTGKIYSTGLDLDWVGEHPDQLTSYVESVQHLLARFLVLPVPTVAALQGHTFAAGAMLALAHDVRLMRADRGYFCLPEVDLGIPFTPAMTALIMGRLPIAAAHEAMTTGRRFDGVAAQACGLVDGAVAEAELLPAAMDRARTLAAKRGATLGTIKERMYEPVVSLLRAPLGEAAPLIG